MADLGGTIDRLEERVRGIAGHWAPVRDSAVHQPRAPGEWTAAESLAHMAEFLPYWADVAREVSRRTEAGRPFGRTHEDPDRIAFVAEHAGDPLPKTLATLEAALERTTRLLREIREEDLERTGVHARRGEMSVRRIIDEFIVKHLDDHASQAESALAKEAAG